MVMMVMLTTVMLLRVMVMLVVVALSTTHELSWLVWRCYLCSQSEMSCCACMQ